MRLRKKVELDILSDASWLEFYRNNPVIAAEDLLIRNGEPLRLPPHQRIILNSLWKGTPFTMMILTRGGGKTAIVAVYFVLRSLLFGNERLGILSGSFRQAKKCFDEVVRFYDESPIVQRSTKGKPSRGNDEHRLEFDNNSLIKALPIGDGQKVRGERFFKIFLDEFPKIDKRILDEVIIPMLATRKNPTAPIQPNEKGNQLILASSATWQFSWAYEYYREYKKAVEAGDEKYALHEFDCDDLGDFMDKQVIEYSKKHMPRVVFLMEYKLLWPKDSHGWIPASLVAKARRSYCKIETKGKEEAEYVLGVDPARESDLFAMSVLRLSPNGNRLVYVKTIHKPTFPQMAAEIREITRKFNIVRIALDYGGGGLSVRDQLAEESGYTSEKGWVEEEPILPIDMKEFPNRYGRRILDVVYFSPKEIHTMNVDLKSDLEHGRLIMPSEPNEGDEESEFVFEEINKLQDELISIVTTVTKTGIVRFDTPDKNMIKDRYTSLLLANKAAKDYVSSLESDLPKAPLASGFWL